MPKLRRTVLFHVPPEHAESSVEDLAQEAVDHAKGGDHVALTLPGGATVDVHPEDEHHVVMAKIAEAMPAPGSSPPPSGKKGKGAAADA